MKSWQEWQPYHHALVLLVKREQPYRTSWYSNPHRKEDFVDGLNTYQCLICGELIRSRVGGMTTNGGVPRHFSALKKHGLIHLKERNLLAFI